MAEAANDIPSPLEQALIARLEAAMARRLGPSPGPMTAKELKEVFSASYAEVMAEAEAAWRHDLKVERDPDDPNVLRVDMPPLMNFLFRNHSARA